MDAAKRHKILVVEDEGLIAHDIADRLGVLGHEVVAMVGTAEEAIERAAEAELVLMDIHLDGRADGIDAATAIQQRYRIPVIFLTAHADRATLERAKAAAPFGYIVKPVAHNALNTSIEIAMHKHRLQRQLEEREAWLRTVLGSVADAVVVCDPAGRVVMLNRAAEVLSGWSQAEAQGQPISKIARLVEEGGDAADDPVAVAMLRDAAVPLPRSWKLVSRGGREMMIEGEAAPVKTAAGTAGAVLSFRDVSARRWEERQIRQAQKLEALGRLAAGVSNDYSSLLGTVRNQAEQLLRQFGEYSPARQPLEEIEQAAIAAEQMNRRLAAFGSRQVSQQEVISLNALLRRMAKLIESVAGQRVEVALRPDPSTLRVKADAAQIEQALMSVVLHACARMTGGGRLLIETRNAELPVAGRMAAHAMLAVTYTAEEPEPERLFEPSSMGEEGIALPVVHTIVTEHGGFIAAQATEGGGCRFEILLPGVAEKELIQAPEKPNAALLSILLVEERDQVRRQLHNFFEAHGYNLLEAEDAAEAAAVSQMHEGPLDLLIGDASCEGLAAELRREHPGMEFLKMADGVERGAHHLRRPFTQKELLEKVETLMAGRVASVAGQLRG